MLDDSQRCHAKSKRTGERCKRRVVPGYRVCYYHGANPKNHGGCPPEKAKGNLNGMIHGAYVERILNEQEQEIHDTFIKALRRDFQLNDSSDEVSAQMAAMAFVQYVRAVKADNAKAADTYDGMVLRHLKSLKATKISREGEKTPTLKTTPAQWATTLLEEVRASDKTASKGKRKREVGKGKATDADRTPEKPQI